MTNPIKPIDVPQLVASVAATGGQPLPSGTLTITRSDGSVVASKDVSHGDATLTAWANGSYWYGDYDFVATYASTAGGETSTDTLVVQVRDLDPPLTQLFVGGGIHGSSVSFGFLTEEDATSECRLFPDDWEPCTSPWTATLPDGKYRLEVTSTDAAGNRNPAPTGSDFWIDTTPPTGTFTINGGAAWTNNTIAQVTVNATDNLQAIWRAYYSLSPEVDADGRLDYQPYGGIYASLITSGKGTFPMDLTYDMWGGTPEDGLKTVYVQFEGGSSGERSQVYSRTIGLDRTLPKVSAPGRALVSNSGISSGKVTVRSTWAGSDTGSGVARYEVAQSTDGGAWTTVSTTLTKPSLDRALLTQHTYRFRVRPVDRAGNVGAWATGSSFTLSRYIESSTRIRYSGTWRSASSTTAYWGGVAKYASAAGARATFTSTGRTVAWVSRKGPTRGKAEIFVNGTKVATVDLYASSWQNQRVVWSTSWSSAATRTVTIRVVGTSGRPRVDLDAIVATN